jgi:hypothetical protein
MTGSTFALIVAVFAAICLWQLLAGLGKMRQARANPQDPRASVLMTAGRIQAIAGGVMLAGNVLLNLPALSALL